MQKPKSGWATVWRRALKKGACPYAGCDIRGKTCEHLDSYLHRIDRHIMAEPEVFYTEEIEIFSKPDAPSGMRVWELFKKLRKYGLANDQLGILIRRYCYSYTDEQIRSDMGWTSHNHLTRRLKKALSQLKDRGYK